MNKRPETNSTRQADLTGFKLEIRPATQEEKEADAKLTAYRRQYWQRYKGQVKRVFGTLDPADYAALKVRAEQTGRSIWAQLWAESQAYRKGATVPTMEIEERQRLLLIELRRIGNNVNQLAKLNHLKAKQSEATVPTSEDIAAAFEQLEQAVAKMSSGR